MKSSMTKRFSGRATLAALAATALLLAVAGVVTVISAGAQSTTSVRPVVFAPVQMSYSNILYVGVVDAEITVALPAVQDAATAFRIQALLPDGSKVTIPIPKGGVSMASYYIWLTYARETSTPRLHIIGTGMTEERTHTFTDRGLTGLVAISVLPATSVDGEEVRAEAAALTLDAVGDGTIGRGSEPYQYGVSPMP